VASHAQGAAAAALAVSARVEGELVELNPEEGAEMRAELRMPPEAGLERLVRAAYELLDLITFFTADRDKEAMARSLRRGGTALDAAGAVHTDLQDTFVKAEVVGWRELVDAGGYVGARERGVLRIEGRDYVVQDGEVVHIRT